jgi:transposase
VKTAVKPLLEKLNAKEMRHVKQSRRQLFETLDAPALKPLPKFEYELSQWAKAKVGPNYHVSFNKHFYSVPHGLVQQEIEIRATAKTIEILSKGLRVASHVRDDTAHKYSTLGAHMPNAHREYAEWTPERLMKWAAKVGPNCVAMVQGIMRRKQHAQQGFTACMGVVSLSNKFGIERVEAACARAVKAQAFSYKSVKAVLRNGLETQPLEVAKDVPLPTHENIRGPGYFN